jgi:hypothetical protein
LHLREPGAAAPLDERQLVAARCIQVVSDRPGLVVCLEGSRVIDDLPRAAVPRLDETPRQERVTDQVPDRERVALLRGHGEQSVGARADIGRGCSTRERTIHVRCQ